MSDALSYDTLVLDGTPRAGDQRLPSGETIVSSPLAVTLVSGARDAVLVDAPFTFGQVDRVRNWIIDSGKTLRAVYVTHAHGDHWLGAGELLNTFPDVPVYAVPAVIAGFSHETTVGREQLWDRVFPTLVPTAPVQPQPVPVGGIILEGHALLPIELGHTDSDNTTALWVPDLRLVLAGDSVYNGVHPYILEAVNGGFESWYAALDTIAALEPEHVVSGHKAPGADDSATIIEQTRTYLQDAQHYLEVCNAPEEFYATMLRRHPYRMNAGPLWYGALGLFDTNH